MGIFSESSTLFTRYACRLELRHKLIGGTPKDPRLIEAWIRTKMGIEKQEELRTLTLRTLLETGVDLPQAATFEEMEEAVQSVAGVKQTVGFKQNAGGLYIESRTIKAMLKEVTNILFAGTLWGKNGSYRGKGPKSFLAERVFVNPDAIALDRLDPDGIEMFVGHITDKLGPRSTLTYYEYVERPVLEFECLVARDAVPHEAWPDLWSLAEENGIGALRSQGFGRFDVTAFARVG